MSVLVTNTRAVANVTDKQFIYRVAQKKRPELLHGVMQQSR